MLKVEEAVQELSQKNLNQIQTETAWKWASRAAASFQNSLTAEKAKKFACFACGEEYAHEALEHAALVDGDDVISQIKKELEPYREKAADHIDQLFGLNVSTS